MYQRRFVHIWAALKSWFLKNKYLNIFKTGIDVDAGLKNKYAVFYAAFRKKVNAFSIFIADGLQITKLLFKLQASVI